MIKKNLMSILLIIFAMSAYAGQHTSQRREPIDEKFGLGVVLGAPTAITGKYWLTRASAVDFGLSWSSDYYFLVYGDYLVHFAGRWGHPSPFVAQTTPYFGIGLGIFNWSSATYYENRPSSWRNYNGDIGVYGRVPFGAEWRPGKPSVGAFAEIAPGISFVPGIGLTIDFGIGVRYYF